MRNLIRTTVLSGAVAAFALAGASSASAQQVIASCPGDGGPPPRTNAASPGNQTAQTFNLATSATVEDVQFLAKGFPAGGGSGNLVVQIYRADSFTPESPGAFSGPTGAPLATGTLPIDSVPSDDFGMITVEFTPPVTLAAGEYALVITATGPGSVLIGLQGDECPGQATFQNTGDPLWYEGATSSDLIYVLRGSFVQAPPSPTASCQGMTVPAINGSEDDETLVGTPNADAIFGGGGNDELDGVDGDDCLDAGHGDDRASGGADDDLVKGNDGRDKVRGLGGKDRLKGQGGQDRLSGGEGRDKLSGGRGADKLRGGAAKDVYKGNAGNDKINAVDAKRDRVNCGFGDDKAVVDPVDRVSRNCETVREVEKD